MSSRRYYLALVSIIVSLIIIILVILISRLGLLPLDLVTTQALQSIQASWFRYFMYSASIFGWFPWSMITVLVGSFLVWKIWSLRIGIYLVIISTIQAPINWVIKTLVARPRPSEPLVDVLKPENGFSFPSGHVMFYTIFFGFLFYLLLRYSPGGRSRYIALAVTAFIILIVGISRIYMGAHWLSDVIAGYLVGLVYLAWMIEIASSLFIGNIGLRKK